MKEIHKEDDKTIRKLNELGLNIMMLARNSLIVNLRFIDSAISKLKLEPFSQQNQGTVEVDGRVIRFNPFYVLTCYKLKKEQPVHDYLHMLLHCIFQHFFVNRDIDPDKWDLASDIAVESIILELNLPGIALGNEEEKEKFIKELKEKAGMLTAEKLYHYFCNESVPVDQFLIMKDLFQADDHCMWHPPKPEDQEQDQQKEEAEKEENQDSQTIENDSKDQDQDNINSQLQEMWQEVAEEIQVDLETFSKKQGEGSDSLIQNLLEVNRERYDYAKFLRKFSVMGEAMQINDDEFDYIFYTYGLNLYGKMPLVEPLEYKEVKKIKEFAIAIDTSESVNGQLVQKFIEKTYNILEQQENFFTQINIHIIQCDTEIQEAVKITSRKEFEDYLASMDIKGFGGTDFRPVFSYVDEMIRTKEFSNFKGLIYFTDGHGKFPPRQPDYKTAFVFIDDEYNNPSVPVWAIKLVLQSNEI